MIGAPLLFTLNYPKKAPFKFNGEIDRVRVHYVTGRGTLMKARHLLLITALIVGGYAQAQAQEGARADRAVARACKDDAQHMCAGKTGSELQQCLKSNQEKLSSNCKDAVSKLPNPPK